MKTENLSSQYFDDSSDEERIANTSKQDQQKLDFELTMNLSDDEDSGDELSQEVSEDEESKNAERRGGSGKKNSTISKKRDHFDAFNASDEEDEEDEDEEEEIKNKGHKNDSSKQKKAKSIVHDDKDVLDEDSYNRLNQKSSLYDNQDMATISAEKIAKIEKKLKKTGVVYISKVPPYMKPAKMRQILSRFGKIDRLFLKPESHLQYQKRVKYGGNKKKMYVEGWAEFLNKRDAKLCVDTLNGQKIGGKKGTFYYDDIMNLKYLKHFKWIDLTSQMAKENEAKQSKLMMEISNANKLNKAFIKNVEKSKMIENIQKKKKQREEQGN